MNRVGWGVLTAILIAIAVAVSSSGADRKTEAMNAAVDFGGDAPALTMPVEGVRASQLTDSWHDPREDGVRMHEALDIAAPRGTLVVAAFAGTVVKLFTSRAGGLTAYVREDDWQAYYAHLDGYASGLREGQRVAAGQTIGFVGDSGNAGAGNTHLHFALHHMAPGDGWWQGTPVNPFPLLAGKPSAR